MARHPAPLTTGEAAAATTAETASMAMMATCETPAMQGEDAASSLLEVMTATSSAQAARGRMQRDVSQWVHLTHHSFGLVASILFSLLLFSSSCAR